MGKKVAVIAFNPVNGSGLFQYLEAFFENNISYKTFAIDEVREIKTNSGISILLNDVIANLRGHENEYDALVFACGDAMLKYNEIVKMPYCEDMRKVIKVFNDHNKLIIGHCAAAVIFDQTGITIGHQVSVHPYGKKSISNGMANDEKITISQNIYTAQTENYISELIPQLLVALK
jgi:putative intracellular protease/amidase